MNKLCPRCERLLPVSEYGLEPDRRDGLTPVCLPCHRIAVNAGYRKQRDRVLEHLGSRCRQCSYSADVRALQIDHRNGDGAQLRRTMSPNRLLRDVLNDDGTRYQLLCANCNSIKRIVADERGSRVYTRKTYPPGIRTSKRCSKCEITKPAIEWSLNAARPDGLSVYCTACTNALQAARYLQLRAQAITHLGGCCKHCGYSTDSRALVIDHVNGSGVVQRKAGTAHRKLLLAVLVDTGGLYQILCANCNMIKRFDQQEHGNREYQRVIPTERIDRPNRRWTPEARAIQSEITRERWATNAEFRAKTIAAQRASMTQRWASGETPPLGRDKN
jgi:hypothetical protein